LPTGKLSFAVVAWSSSPKSLQTEHLKTLLRIFSSVTRYPAIAFAVLALAVISTLLVLVPPLMTKRFLDEIIGQGRQDLIVPTALIAVGAIALRPAAAEKS